MKDYSYGEIAGMQMKALEEAREMNGRSSFPKEEKQAGERRDCENCKNYDCKNNPSKRKGGLLSGIDDDKLLVLALLLVLSKDQCDKSMLIALAYILL